MRYNDMNLRWTDIRELAFALDDAHPQIDPKYINFVDLRNWVISLPNFIDVPDHSGEKLLEAIQLAWIEVRE